MEFWLWSVIGILLLVIGALLIKIYLLKKSAREIEEAFADRLTKDTNTLIDISGNDKSMRRLAASINTQLHKLRQEHLRFVQGDRELKNAVTNISHDLRTPLTAIYGYLDLLEEEEKPETVCRYLEVIKNRTEILNQLIEELFQYSVLLTIEDGDHREMTVINEVLEESIAAFYTVLKERKITPAVHLPEKRIERELNRGALSRVFSNLISNGLKYSDGDLEITLLETGKIVFTNTASQLDEIQVGKLFDRFYTVETARKSTGLGLSIARTLVEQMNGTITAKYEKNQLSISVQL